MSGRDEPRRATDDDPLDRGGDQDEVEVEGEVEDEGTRDRDSDREGVDGDNSDRDRDEDRTDTHDGTRACADANDATRETRENEHADDAKSDTHDPRTRVATAFGTELDPLAAHAATFAALDEDVDVDVDPFALFGRAVLDARDPAERTRQGYRRAITQWRAYMASQGRHPACPNETHVRGFARHRQCVHGNRPATILTKLRRLHRIFQYWQDDPAFPHTRAYDPFALALASLALDRGARREYPWLSLATLRAVVGSIPHVRARALVVCQLKLGLRATEVCNLRIGDLNVRDSECRRWYDHDLGTHDAVAARPNAVYVAPKHERAGNKSVRPRVLPVDEELQRVLRTWLLVRPQPGSPWVFLTEGTHTQLDAASVNRAWTDAFHPRFAATDTHRAVTSHYGRHRFTTFWRVEQDLPRELVQYMRGDVLGNRTTTDDVEGEQRQERGRNRTPRTEAIDDYLHAYYEDIEAVYRERMYTLEV